MPCYILLTCMYMYMSKYAWWLISVIVYCVIYTSVYLNLLSLCLFEFIFQLFLESVVHIYSIKFIDAYRMFLTCMYMYMYMSSMHGGLFLLLSIELFSSYVYLNFVFLMLI